jgi:hypothetical protein
VDLKLLSPFRGFVDIAYLLVQRPQANVIVGADGHTNVPSPKVPGKGDKTALQQVWLQLHHDCSKMLMFQQRPETVPFSLYHTVNRT